MAKRKSLADRVHDSFYRWFSRRHPSESSLIADGFTRRDLRDAFEAGHRRGKRAHDDISNASQP